MCYPMRDLFDLTGKVAIVTGGNGGIGRAIALGLAQHGADIVVAARNAQKTAAVVGEVEAMGRRCVGVRCDVLQQDDITATVATTVRETPSLAASAKDRMLMFAPVSTRKVTGPDTSRQSMPTDAATRGRFSSPKCPWIKRSTEVPLPCSGCTNA